MYCGRCCFCLSFFQVWFVEFWFDFASTLQNCSHLPLLLLNISTMQCVNCVLCLPKCYLKNNTSNQTESWFSFFFFFFVVSIYRRKIFTWNLNAYSYNMHKEDFTILCAERAIHTNFEIVQLKTTIRLIWSLCSTRKCGRWEGMKAAKSVEVLDIEWTTAAAQ